MYKRLLATLITTLGFILVAPTMAGDAEACLECHEPAEDWEGMSIDELLAAAIDPGNKRHNDNGALTEEQLRAIFAELLPQ